MIAMQPGLTQNQLQQQIQQIENSSPAEKQIITKNLQQYLNFLTRMQLILDQADFPTNQQIITCINEYFSQNNYNPKEIKNKKVLGYKQELGETIKNLFDGNSKYREAQQKLITKQNSLKQYQEQPQEENTLQEEESYNIINLQQISGFINLNIYAQQLEQKFDKQTRVSFMLHFLVKPNYSSIFQTQITQNQLKDVITYIKDIDLNILGLKNKDEINENILLSRCDILEKYGAIEQSFSNYNIKWQNIYQQNKNQIVLQLLQSRYNGDAARIVYCLQNSQQPLSIESIQNKAVVDANNVQQNIFKLIQEGWIQQQGQLYTCNNELTYQVAKDILCNSLSNLIKKQHQLQLSMESTELNQLSYIVEQLKSAVSIFI